MRPLLCLLVTFVLCGTAFAQTVDDETCPTPASETVRVDMSRVAEPFEFSGLASYLDNVSAYTLSGDGLEALTDETVRVDVGDRVVIAARFKMIVLEGVSGTARRLDDQVVIDLCADASAPVSTEFMKTGPNAPGGDLDKLRYAHLWAPLAWLARLVEGALATIHTVTGNWGLSIVLLAVVMRLLFLPVVAAQTKAQDRVNENRRVIEPKLKAIKSEYDGEEAHERILATYKDQGLSPFYTLKPLLFPFIQVPVLVAIFNALGEMSQLDETSFLWIENLAYPDSIARLPVDLPVFGGGLNLLPIVMTVSTIVAALLFRGAFAEDAAQERRKLYLMAAFFFVLFYAFPAGMVLYWTVANLLQVSQQAVMKYLER